MKINVEKPIYNSGITDGQPSASVTSLTFNGKYYVGDKGRNKKESQNLAARAAILSLLGTFLHFKFSVLNLKKKKLSRIFCAIHPLFIRYNNSAMWNVFITCVDSDANMVISKIISKWRLSSLKDKVKLPLVEQGKVREAKNSVGIYPQ